MLLWQTFIVLSSKYLPASQIVDYFEFEGPVMKPANHAKVCGCVLAVTVPFAMWIPVRRLPGSVKTPGVTSGPIPMIEEWAFERRFAMHFVERRTFIARQFRLSGNRCQEQEYSS